MYPSRQILGWVFDGFGSVPGVDRQFNGSPLPTGTGASVRSVNVSGGRLGSRFPLEFGQEPTRHVVCQVKETIGRVLCIEVRLEVEIVTPGSNTIRDEHRIVRSADVWFRPRVRLLNSVE